MCQLIDRSEKDKTTGKLIAPSFKEQNKVRTKLAETFNTNRTYVSDAERLKKENPAVFEQVKRGEKTKQFSKIDMIQMMLE